MKKARNSLKLIACTSMCIFTLAAAVVSAYAWFEYTAKGEANGTDFGVVNSNIPDVETMTIHKCNLSASTSAVLQFDSNPSIVMDGTGQIISTSNEIDMNNYSHLNQTEPVLLLLAFKSGIIEGKLTISALSSSNSFVSQATNANIESFPFSSAVRFQTATYNSSVTSFPFNNVQVSDLSSYVSFVTMTNSNPVSVNFNNRLTLLDNNNNNEISYLAIVLDYYPAVIDYIILQTDINVFAAHENTITFVCDWVFNCEYED